MLNMMNNDKYVANILYKQAIEEEIEWRKDKGNALDIAVVDELLQEVRDLGYRYEYLADITHRDNKDSEILNVLLQYIGRFEDEGISAMLVGIVGQKGNTAATETIIKNYMESSKKNKYMQAGFYDNALYRIKDKRYIQNYLELLKNPTEASRFPLTMIMLGKWRIAEAKPYFMGYLNYSDETNNIVFISLEALSYYEYTDGTIVTEIEKKVKSNNIDLAIAAKKALKRHKLNYKH